MSQESPKTLKDWAVFRFSVVGGLLACPPGKGELQDAIRGLSERKWRDPITNREVRYGFSTIERWYYQALGSEDPIKALMRKVRLDAGNNRTMSSVQLQELDKQYQRYPKWSYQLHFDNLLALIKDRPELGLPPSYATVRRRMHERGWRPKKSGGANLTAGRQKAAKRLEQREVRGFEAEYVNQLWHLDFHHTERRVVDSAGRWYSAVALCILDDRSRLCCHFQWYLRETAEVLIHGLSQAFHKRGLPRALMHDNGAAMVAHETENGLARLAIFSEHTLPHSPYQNGKVEVFWAVLEGRLMSMLTHVEPLSLDFLNEASLAWVEQEYNRKLHAELGTSPLDQMLKGPNVGRSSPDSETLRLAFTLEEHRTQRRSDGTVTIKGVRFELPSRFQHLDRVTVRYASWDLSTAWVVDPRTGQMLARITPQDKLKNASGIRRQRVPMSDPAPPAGNPEPIPPLLRKILSDYAATGLPPAYIPKEVNTHES